VRTAWVSFDVMGRRCLVAAAEAGADVVGIVTLPGPIDPNRSGQCAFDDIAQALGAALLETTDVNAAETVDAVRGLEPELIFVIGWSQLVRDPFLRTASAGVYGMHPTLLPRHRGRAPIPWAILSGLARTGVTLFEITDATADAGPIVGQVDVEIARDETATTLFDKLSDAHEDLIRTHVPQLLAGTAPKIPQDARRASAWPKRTPADGIIDWETRAPYLDAWVRAQTHPYPGAFTFRGDERLVIWRAREVDRATRRGAAGTVVEVREDGPIVACGEGALLLEELEPALRLDVGDRLG
jgi:methionyl-tRNA formyltransferase